MEGKTPAPNLCKTRPMLCRPHWFALLVAECAAGPGSADRTLFLTSLTRSRSILAALANERDFAGLKTSASFSAFGWSAGMIGPSTAIAVPLKNANTCGQSPADAMA